MSTIRSLLRFFKPKTLLPFGDLLLVNLGVLAALRLWAIRAEVPFGQEFFLPRAHWFPIVSSLWLVLAITQGFYTEKTVVKPVDTLVTLLRISFLLVFLYILGYFFVPIGTLPRGVILYTGAASVILVGLWRLAYIYVSTGSLSSHLPKPAEEGAWWHRLLHAMGEGRGAGQPAVSLQEEVFTTDEVAEMLKVHRVTVWRWCKSGKLPAIQVGQRWRIRASDLQAFIKARTNAGFGATP